MSDEQYRIPPRCAKAILFAAGGSVIGMVGLSFIALPLVGFGAAGPVAGSLAAWVQSMIGASVPSGSLFALLQSIGMAGIGVSTGVVVTGTTAGLALAICQALGCPE